MPAQEPSSNDNEFTLLKKLVLNTAILATGDVSAGSTSISIVEKHADLPTSLDIAPVDSVYLVLHSSGVWPITDHSSGFYIRRGNSINLSDWEEL